MVIQKTLNMANATGYTMTLVPLTTTKDDYIPTSVTVTATVACWVQMVTWKASTVSAPATLVATPAPGVGVTADYYHMAVGETKEFGVKRGSLFSDPSKFGAMDYFQFVSIWSEGAGELKVVAY